MLVAVLCEPRGDELLGAGESTGCQHLGAERVRLQLVDVGLLTDNISSGSLVGSSRMMATYPEIPLGPSIILPTCDSRPDILGDGVLPARSWEGLSDACQRTGPGGCAGRRRGYARGASIALEGIPLDLDV